jgi:hypothetical protein
MDHVVEKFRVVVERFASGEDEHVAAEVAEQEQGEKCAGQRDEDLFADRGLPAKRETAGDRVHVRNGPPAIGGPANPLPFLHPPGKKESRNGDISVRNVRFHRAPHPGIPPIQAFQLSSFPAFQHFSISAFQLFSISAFQHFSFSAFQETFVPVVRVSSR